MISAKKLMLFIETTLRTLPFIKVSLKSDGSSIFRKDPSALLKKWAILSYVTLELMSEMYICLDKKKRDLNEFTFRLQNYTNNLTVKLNFVLVPSV